MRSSVRVALAWIVPAAMFAAIILGLPAVLAKLGFMWHPPPAPAASGPEETGLEMAFSRPPTVWRVPVAPPPTSVRPDPVVAIASENAAAIVTPRPWLGTVMEWVAHAPSEGDHEGGHGHKAGEHGHGGDRHGKGHGDHGKD